MPEQHYKLDVGGDTRELNISHRQESYSGSLPKPIDPCEFNTSGTIKTAVDVYLNRSTAIDSFNSHFTVDMDAGSIELTINENMPMIRKTFLGKLRPSLEIMHLGINSDAKTYDLKSLKRTLRSIRSLFDTDENFISVMTKLDNPQLVSMIASELSNDKRGSKAEKHEVTAQSNNIPKGFRLNIPLFKGMPGLTANVWVDLCFMHENHQNASFWLESFDLMVKEHDTKIGILQDEVARLEGIASDRVIPAIIYA